MNNIVDEALNCPVCRVEITIKNAVNPSCGHTHCNECFWEWSKHLFL